MLVVYETTIVYGLLLTHCWVVRPIRMQFCQVACQHDF